MDWHKRFTEQATWTAEIRKYFFARVEFQTGQNILEVGCGTGSVMQAINEELALSTQPAPQTSKLFGLDIDANHLRTASNYDPQPFLTLGDGYRLPYRDDTFDIVYCHYLLLWTVDPDLILVEMKRVLRPGGWLAAFAEPDYGGRVDYPFELQALGKIQTMGLRSQDAEPYRGRQLRSLFTGLHLHQVESGILGAQWREPDYTLNIEDEWQVIIEDTKDLISPSELARYYEIDVQSQIKSERVLFIPTFYAFGQKLV